MPLLIAIMRDSIMLAPTACVNVYFLLSIVCFYPFIKIKRYEIPMTSLATYPLWVGLIQPGLYLFS